MKKNRFISCLLIVTFLTSFVSCSDDFLDKESTSQISADKVFASKETIAALRTGLYAELAYKGKGALYTLILPLNSEFRGNDIVYGKKWWKQSSKLYEFKDEETDPNVAKMWNMVYYITEITNSITTQLGSKSSAAKVEGGLQLLAEAKAIRAMVYTDISRFYGKAYHLDAGASKSMPYSVELQYDASKPGVIKKPFRNTMKEIYDLAIKDFNDALDDLPVTKGNENFMNKGAVHALLSRLYLDMHDYEKAKLHASKAIDGTSLMTSESYLSGDLSRKNSESILCFASDLNNYSKWRNINSFFDNYDGMGEDFLVNPSLFETFSSDDLRVKFFVPERFDNPNYPQYKYYYSNDFESKPDVGLQLSKILNSNGYFAHAKMPRKDSDYKANITGSVGLGDYNYIRTSELVLTIAECEARLGNVGVAKSELLKIQKRSISNATISTKVGEDLIDEILLERRKELFGEGHSYRDILRLGKGLQRDGTHPVKLNLPAGDPRFQLPIPFEAKTTNPNLLK